MSPTTLLAALVLLQAPRAAIPEPAAVPQAEVTPAEFRLDVHDPGGRRGRVLEAGMVITVEPGIYLPEEQIGFRIDDVVLVTDTGYEHLSRFLPREADELEALLAKLRAESPPLLEGSRFFRPEEEKGR